MSAPECKRTPPMNHTCLERLADGWILATDLCSGCTRAFMTALDGVRGPMVWHPNYLARAEQ